jgi:AcrR family transcriptional regulator
MGRKLEFSKDKALLQAMEGFWSKGYDATSMRDLAQRLNLHLGSVYNALGDKEEVFEQSLRLYLKHQVIPRMAELENSEDPRAALNAFMALGRDAWRDARARIQTLLSSECPTLRDDAALQAKALLGAGA